MSWQWFYGTKTYKMKTWSGFKNKINDRVIIRDSGLGV